MFHDYMEIGMAQWTVENWKKHWDERYHKHCKQISLISFLQRTVRFDRGFTQLVTRHHCCNPSHCLPQVCRDTFLMKRA